MLGWERSNCRHSVRKVRWNLIRRTATWNAGVGGACTFGSTDSNDRLIVSDPAAIMALPSNFDSKIWSFFGLPDSHCSNVPCFRDTVMGISRSRPVSSFCCCQTAWTIMNFWTHFRYLTRIACSVILYRRIQWVRLLSTGFGVLLESKWHSFWQSCPSCCSSAISRSTKTNTPSQR